MKLAEHAIAASQRAVCAVSNFPVGAAVQAADGRVFEGCNVESPSLLHVVCAERVALLAALSAGAREIEAIAVHAPKRADITPCGLCLQMIAEFAPAARILLVADRKNVREVSLADLLPNAFRL
ncbi:MAG: cytidine deaminase [Deltaproteobacteria bacterium]|nr:cytidine deaminase [Deltaproteobacteria bacterium]